MNPRCKNRKDGRMRTNGSGTARLRIQEIYRTLDNAEQYCDLRAQLSLLRKDQEGYDAYVYAGNFLHDGLVKARRLVGEVDAL